MGTLIKERRVVADTWRLLSRGPEGELPEAPAQGDVIVPLALWLARRENLLSRAEAGHLGVWLEANEGPEAIAADLQRFAIIAVNFPKFGDGRGYSIARLLRERYGYKGELRAIGDVLHDHLHFMKQCGFDAFVLREDQDANEALSALDTFSDGYQTSALRPVPLFRRRLAGGKIMNESLKRKVADLERLLVRAALEHAPATLASSLSAEDMVISDVILRHKLDIEIFTLDTGRLHADTLNVIAAVRERYGYEVRIFRPDPAAVAEYVETFGRDAFYQSVELRKRCCYIRKVEPLDRALEGKEAWITGQRREQAVTRSDLKIQEYDTGHGIVKFNPLADWSEEEVWSYIRAFNVPYNALHDQGYRSIGCAPCTRPTVAGEDVRAGRWWWEIRDERECGLHVTPDGRLARVKEPA